MASRPSSGTRRRRLTAVPADSTDHTFLFADLAGFAALTEVHGDEEAAELVGAFCGVIRDLLPRYGGEEVKTIGDAVMVRLDRAADGIRPGWRSSRHCAAGPSSRLFASACIPAPRLSATEIGWERASTSPRGWPARRAGMRSC